MRQAVTVLSDEEELFRETVRDFSDREVAPGAIERDRKGAIEPELIAKLFEIGVMSVEIPERFGGAGRIPDEARVGKHRLLRTFGSRLGERCLRARDTGRCGWRRFPADGPQALDHECGGV